MTVPKRWIAGPADGPTVRHVLARIGTDEHAIRDGRVFIGRKRVRRDDEAIHDGDVVEVAPAQERRVDVRILEHRDDLVAVEKPAGVPTIGDHQGTASALVELCARALGRRAAALHPTSRLDKEVSGVVIFALTAEAAQRLVRARETGSYGRRYVALASGSPKPPSGSWDAPIGRATNPRLRAAGGRQAAASCTHYRACALAGAAAMLAVVPVTGRTHQIRVHAAHAGAPLLGDRAYGGPGRLVLGDGRVIEPGRIALHALRVDVPDRRGGRLVAVAPVPVELKKLWSDLGGDVAAWEVSSTCDVP